MQIKALPATVRRAIEIMGLCALGFLIVQGKGIIMPLLVALFVSILLLPLLRWLRKHKVPEVLAIVVCIICLFLIIAGIAAFLSYQIGMLVTDMETAKNNVSMHWNRLSAWIASTFHYSLQQQMAFINEQVSSFGDNVNAYIKQALSSFGNLFIFFGLMPIYIFFILFYRKMFYRFVLMWFPDNQQTDVHETIVEIEVIVKYYLIGLMIQITYLAVLVGGALYLFGIPHALLIGVTFAILNLIPYLGPLVGNLIGVMLTLTSSQNFWHIIIVLVTIAIVQFFDNNIFFPRIMGNKVKVNALASIVGIVLGGTLAGVEGMFVSIPTLAVLKILFDKSETLRPWGVLLGEESTPKNQSTTLAVIKSWRKKKDN